MNAETNKEETLPTELSVSSRGGRPFATFSDQESIENAARLVTEEDRQNLLTNHSLAILNWLAMNKPYVPRQKVRDLIDETVGPLISNALTQVLRISIRDLESEESVDRIFKLQVTPKDRPEIPVLVMIPFEEKLETAWNLYYCAVRHWMNYLVEGDSRDVSSNSQGTILDFGGGHRRSDCIATSHRAEAKRYLCVAIKEMIRLSPQILRTGELTYILSELVGVLNGLRAKE